MLSVEKVYDELYGMIEDLKKKIAAMSGGDEVTITPALESGVKVADFTIGEDTGSIYAPNEVAGIYSSTETLVGTYGGQNLYRTVIVDETPLTGTYTSVDVSAKDIDKVVKVSGFFKTVVGDVEYYTPMPFFDGTNAGYIDTVDASAVIMQYNATIASNRGGKGYVVILEYTKTPEETRTKKTRKK